MVFFKNFSLSLSASLGILLFLPFVAGHGLVEDPPSRNQICGVITKPHEVTNGVAEYPECGAVFAQAVPETSGYSFMSVLTHDYGRKVVTPLPSYVCGFESETWPAGMTPWDAVNVDWPTTEMTAGPNTFTWNIEWGPHFDDTEEFVYWITKADFVYDSSQQLTWNDFEATPFCDEGYNDSNPTGNPNIVPDKTYNKFYTTCNNVPNRSGRHIIYAEWGRNQWTKERFHGCIDVQFSGSPVSTPATTPAATTSTVAATTTTVAATTSTPGSPSMTTTSAGPPPTPFPTPNPTPPPPTPTSPPPGPNPDCDISFQDGRNPWFVGFMIGFETPTATIDFSGTGLDLGDVSVQAGNFAISIDGPVITLTKPAWLSLTNKGYMGMNGNNVEVLATMPLPVCTIGT